MLSLTAHLEKLSWEKREKNKEVLVTDRLVSPTPLLSPLPVQDPLTPLDPLTPVGKYLVPLSLRDSEPSPHPLTSQACLDSTTGEELSCRVYDLKWFQSKAALFSIGSGVAGVHKTRDVLFTNNRAFIFSDKHYGDLHQYLQEKKKLKEVEAASLFSQIVDLVREAHSCGIALRDIKLKKFVFVDARRTSLSLHYLDDAQLMESSGLLADRHGCPAYVCPEMLQPGSYSAEAADLWSLGVILYTLLVGHYPFFDSSTQNLFSKIQTGYYQVPDHVSQLSRSLISYLLTYDPSSRVPAAEILVHPWFQHASDDSFLVALSNSASLLHLKDQTVPN